MKSVFAAAIAIFALGLTTHSLAADLKAVDPWIPEAPPNARMLAGYMQLKNTGDEDIRIVDARSDALFGRVEIHRSETIDGMSRMRRIPVLEIPAGGEAILERGGLHLMLMRPERVPVSGETVTIELLNDADEVILTVEAEVRPRPSED